MDQFDFIWSKALETIKTSVGVKAFDNFFADTSMYNMDFETNQATILVPHPVKINFLKKHYSIISEALTLETGGIQFEMNFTSTPTNTINNEHAPHPSNFQNLALQQRQQQEKNTSNLTSQLPNPTIKTEYTPTKSNLNPGYTLDNFVRGSGNEFAYVAAVTVAESPGTTYNPFFIYGAPGLGKTHLMQAIGNEILKNNPQLNILYLTTEKFTNEFIQAIRNNTNDIFREKYRNIDVLLIDDVQFLQKKESTQEEFFNTFETLEQEKKQIVITSDRSPEDLKGLEERLVSRFSKGLITDVTPPDLETRIAILKQKTLEINITMTDDAIYTLANYVQTNVRELEGDLTRVTAFAQLHHRPIDSDLIHDALKKIKKTHDPTIISIKMIKKIVAKHYNITEADLHIQNRSRKLIIPRQVAMYLARQLTDMSLPKIGEDFKRDHTTVMHSIEKIEDKLKEDEIFKQEFEQLKNKVINNN